MNTPLNNNRLAIYSMMLTFFLDFIGLFMVYPIFAPLFLDSNSPMLDAHTSHFRRTLIVGTLTMIYGVGQFFGGPLLGELSDQFGRKRILILGLSILVIANLLGAFALAANILWLLFVGRFLTGVASGNGSVIFAAVSNMSVNDTERGINLGYLAGAASLGCVLAPMVGSHLSSPAFISWFSWYTPFLFMAIIFLLNLLLIAMVYKDTGTYQRRPLSLTTGFHNIVECFKMPQVNIMLLIYFLFVLSTESTFTGLPIFAVEKFQVSSTWLGYLFGFGSLVAAFSSIYLNKQLSKKFNSYIIVLLASGILCLGYALYLVTPSANWLYLAYGLVGLTCATIWSQQNAIIANMVDAKVQGKVLGVTQSLLSLALIIGPASIGFIASVHYNFIPILCLIAGLLSWIIFIKFYLQFVRK
ncbi:transporter of the major facilitator superfamily (MFS) [Legionella busanensis]|uniref:Transporter of the major facilitator superfamily (MFS) n=1 Tax=Legionella busanensis TaxID=190655 RepID=A0A378JL23_9GAMM|nr:MFS transporter [Legionella busanensis]STX51935.1 transporter of the major facilitator superfamily (MFS) [Legionella busanensis]